MMYVHSWQSWCWNRLVSWRLKHLGLGPVPGDLVAKEKGGGDSQAMLDEGHMCMYVCAHAGEVAYVTEANVSEYSLTDVVIPLPGYSVQLPKHGGVASQWVKSQQI